MDCPIRRILVYIDGTEQINHQAAKYRAKRAGRDRVYVADAKR